VAEIYKISLKNMLFSASVGVSGWEREVPTSLEIDLEIEADLKTVEGEILELLKQVTEE